MTLAIVYKAPARNMGKALIAGVMGWQDTPDLTVSPGNVVAKPLEHVIAANVANKFIAYNNIPPDIPKVKTKSNSKGVLMMNPNAADEASWIVHTIPGFPKALRGYVFPPAEIQKGHLFICLTIKGSEIDAIAMALRIATPLIYHNDIPDTQMNSRPNLKNLVNGESRLTPPLTVAQQISTAAAPGLKVTIYSKGEKSKYEIYRKVLVKKLKTSIKVWTTRDKILKTDCRILNRNIKLVTSPITIGGHASSLESDVSQWLISDPGNKFCAVDKPYHKSQTKEPGMAVCIDDASIFGHFNAINFYHIASYYFYCSNEIQQQHSNIQQQNFRPKEFNYLINIKSSYFLTLQRAGLFFQLSFFTFYLLHCCTADLVHCETDTRRIARALSLPGVTTS
ncbi:deoxyribonuclease II family protein [Trichinella spiralis]|uniref:deoxyribonuclease II family protein n=1 Tax=Trichinella spiralis TaxID=6334 RepID=UPI0001EFC795|nr:deoxyribonuclease II family protein [Trichinella spiralis]